MTTHSQIFQGIVVGIWAVIADAPVRNTSSGKLEWVIACVEGHRTKVEHSALSYNVVPSVCTVCADITKARRAADKIAEKMIVKEAVAEMLAAKKQAQIGQIAGIAEQDKPSSHIRAIQIAQQGIGEEVNASTVS